MNKRKGLAIIMSLVLFGVLFAGPAVMAQENTDEDRDLLREVDSDYVGMEDEAIDEVLRLHKNDLMAIEGVVEVMTMEMDGVPSIIVFVDVDNPEAANQIPGELDGYPVLVEVEQELTIMPFGAEDDDEDEGVTTDLEEASDGEVDTDEEDGGINAIYVAVGAVVMLLLLLVLRKGS